MGVRRALGIAQGEDVRFGYAGEEGKIYLVVAVSMLTARDVVVLAGSAFRARRGGEGGEDVELSTLLFRR